MIIGFLIVLGLAGAIALPHFATKDLVAKTEEVELIKDVLDNNTKEYFEKSSLVINSNMEIIARDQILNTRQIQIFELIPIPKKEIVPGVHTMEFRVQTKWIRPVEIFSKAEISEAVHYIIEKRKAV
jgi:hypothetical protein